MTLQFQDKVGVNMTEFDSDKELFAEQETQQESWGFLEPQEDDPGEPEGVKPPSDHEKFDLKREIVEWMEAIVYSLVAVVLIFTFLFRIVGVDGESMTNTLQDQDRLIVTHLFYEPKQGDIIVTTQPSAVNKPLIKRIIAVEGQTVDINFETHQVIVDGEVLDEPYIREPTSRKGDIEFPITVEPGKVFVMGDNRNDSLDSRFAEVGQIDKRYILGKAVFRIFPFNAIGGLK